jgi:hypothetical protein
MTSVSGPLAAMAANPMFKGMSQMVEKMKEIEGFPLASSSRFSMMGQAIESGQEATRVEVGPIPPQTFDLAAIAPGYRKVDSPIGR